jgi:hypothetical protein
MPPNAEAEAVDDEAAGSSGGGWAGSHAGWSFQSMLVLLWEGLV